MPGIEKYCSKSVELTFSAFSTLKKQFIYIKKERKHLITDFILGKPEH